MLHLYLEKMIFGSLFGALVGTGLGFFQAMRESPPKWPRLDYPTPFLDTDEHIRKCVNFLFVFKKYAPKTYDKMIERMEMLIALWITVCSDTSYGEETGRRAQQLRNDLTVLMERMYTKVLPHIEGHEAFKKALYPCLIRLAGFADDYLHNICVKTADNSEWQREQQRLQQRDHQHQIQQRRQAGVPYRASPRKLRTVACPYPRDL